MFHTLCSVWHRLVLFSDWRARLAGMLHIAGSYYTAVSFGIDVIIAVSARYSQSLL